MVSLSPEKQQEIPIKWENTKMKINNTNNTSRRIKKLNNDEETEKLNRKVSKEGNGSSEKQRKKLELSFETDDFILRKNYFEPLEISSISLKDEYESLGSEHSLYQSVNKCEADSQNKSNPRGPYNHYNTVTKKQAIDMVEGKIKFLVE
jgi:hypothetical protein